MSMPEIKPCPICNAQATVVETVLGWFAECSKNGHIHNVGTFGGELSTTKEAAIKEWNRRARDENNDV